jgi:hypothetical protein
MVNFGGCKKSAPPGPRKAAIANYRKYNNLRHPDPERSEGEGSGGWYE